MTGETVRINAEHQPAHGVCVATMDLEEKFALLQRTLEELGSVLVAYSGGTDSAFLAYAAHQALGDRMIAVIADSASLPRKELAAAVAFAEQQRFPLQILHTDELANPHYARNDAQRCFHCKDELFTQMERRRAELGFAHIAYGMNLDDKGEFRPGQQAAAMHHAKAPLMLAQLTKAEIRELARHAGLTLADKPASACLSSRIEYGRAVTPENLLQVEMAEEALHALGLRQVRVRHHGDLARVEVGRAEMAAVRSMAILDEVSSALKALGFKYVTLDMQGYRSGSMNDVLPVSALRSAPRLT